MKGLLAVLIIIILTLVVVLVIRNIEINTQKSNSIQLIDNNNGNVRGIDDSDLTIIKERDGCAQENYGKVDYCAGLSEGDSIPSCDSCNKCSCKTIPPENYLLPTCTEMACK